MINDTIAAIATPIGKGGIGIVRVSGSSAFEISLPLFHLNDSNENESHPASSDAFQSHRLHLGQIKNPQNTSIIDEVLLVVMKAPHSYTCEDVVEIQSHGGFVVLEQILKLLLQAGARLADPGEFTRRAFLNGRIDLSQAEAVEAMISAKTEAGSRMAAHQLGGGLGQSIVRFCDLLTEVQVELEADIEFSDEIESSNGSDHLIGILQKGRREPVQTLIDQYDHGHVFKDGIRMDIVGRPNVGKSSLLNRLIQKNKAIVTELPGTTRDLVEDHVSICGIPVLITDTAGIHCTDDPIEILGIKKTRENIERSDIVLWVVDAQKGITVDDESIHEQIKGPKTLLVINKVDLLDRGKKIAIKSQFGSIPKVYLSAKYGDGIDELRKMIKDICTKSVDIDPAGILIANFRQKQALDQALEAILRAIEGLETGLGAEMVVQDLVDAKNALYIITGERINDDVLDDIFNKFCIGK